MTDKAKSAVVKLISRSIEDLAPQKTQTELAKEMGFRKPNMLSMIKTGRADVPFHKIPEIAQVLGIDPALLLRLHLKDQWPSFGRVVDRIFGGILTKNEKEWLILFQEIRVEAPPTDRSDRHIVKEILRTLKWPL